ncbi:MAG: hypothetical protein K2X81_03610 [Candidatus Obscuribacterales bacterium]|nr:hypothetical protein [Candidatus Obscuribacterales bacterium]
MAYTVPRVIDMESGKASKLDEKTAHLIEEMDKSLHTMEQNLGPDHLVVSKILDSYAKLLRQNNTRHLDALNMEARAKAIRAKHNQQEAEKQSQGIDTENTEKKVLTASKIRLAVWVLSVIALGFITYFAVDAIKRSSQSLAKTRNAAKATGPEGKIVQSDNKIDVSPNIEGLSSEQSTATETEKSQDASSPDSGNEPDASANSQNAPALQPNGMTMLEVAEKILKVKNLAKEKLELGLEAEKQNDMNAAAQDYLDVVKETQETSNKVGRQVCSEEIAQCFEGYGRVADLAGHTDIAKEYEKAAASIREHISQ